MSHSQNPAGLLSRLDDQSRAFAHIAAQRLCLYAGGTALGWLIFTSHGWGDLATDFQFMCNMGAVMAIARACLRRIPATTPSLNDWDEGMLLNLLGLGVHIAKRMMA